MFQQNRARLNGAAGPPARQAYARGRVPAASEQTSLVLAYWRTLARQRWLILGVTGVGALAGLASTLYAPAIYRARTSVEVQVMNEDFMNLKAVDPTDKVATSSTESLIQTQIKLLESQSLIFRVIQRMRESGSADRVAKEKFTSPLARFGLADERRFSFDRMLDDIARTMTVKPLGMTRLVEVTCQSPDRALAAQFCNTVADEFVAQDLELRSETARRTVAWVDRQLREVRATLQQSEQKLQAFAGANSLLFNQERESVAEDKLRLLQGGLSQAEVDRVAREAQYRVGSSRSPESLPAVLDDEPSKQARIKLAELERQRAEFATVFTPDAPQLVKIDAQIKALETSEQKAQSNMIARLRNEFDAARSREEALEAAYKSQEKIVAGHVAKSAQLNMLQRDAESGRTVYTALMQKVKEAEFALAIKASPIRIVDRAAPGLIPVGPPRLGWAGMGGLGGMFLGVMFAFIRERSDTRFRVPGDAGKHCSVREFGVIPSARSATLRDGAAKGQTRLTTPFGAKALTESSRVPPDRENLLELVTWTRKRSLMAEAYRSAMSSILFSGQRAGGKSIVVSSARMGEGKTTLISNLGIAFAEAGRRVVLVDGDLRAPRLHRIFNLGKSWGLQDALRGDVDAEDCDLGQFVQPTWVPNLFVVPAGSGPKEPSLLLQNGRLKPVLQRLEAEFDVVLIDTPPLLHLSDARTIAQFATGVVLVFRAGVARREIATATLDMLEGDGTPVLGVILNDFDPKSEAMYGYYTDYYQYSGKAAAAERS
ncbi:MAG: polysaccharide biosynthesis transport protein [Bryobacterales bacterium]|nr:polysaccharide biosynthesis transport protein [Bryobacterales bacterium]